MPKTSSQPEPSVSRTKSGTGSKNGSPRAPILTVDREGTIQDINSPARRVLEYSPDDPVDSCFFSHVHGHNLRRVMRDLAHMVSHRRQRVRWLLRLQTGNGRWRWYRAVARNHLDHSNGAIQVHLRPL